MKWLLPALLSVFAASAQTANNWVRQIPQNFPSARAGAALAYDALHGRIVLFGGSNGMNLNDTWVWDGANWTQMFPATSPPARIDAGMAFDALHGVMVLFGGHVNADNPYSLNDTWLWDGTNWTQMTPQNSPSARFDFGMAYDSKHSQIVLFGGEGTTNPTLADTWTWDGSNWTLQAPQISPPGRWGGAMAYDSAHGQTVLFAGLNYPQGNGQDLQDTWVWDGINWTQEFPLVSPPARHNHCVVFDVSAGQIFLFGGSETTMFGDHVVNDTWVWDGSMWTQETPSTSPPVRTGPAMAYDVAHSQVVLFGGEPIFSLGLLQDTWTWYTPPPIVPPAVHSVVSASSFGGLSSGAPGSWIEIYGSNLAPDTRGWKSSDFAGENAPTALDHVSVSIGGEAAFVDYISPAQVNAQLPSNISTGGPLDLTVTNSNGVSSALALTVNPTAPGLLASPPFKIGANQYVVAQLADGNYVLPVGAISGVNSRPAKPGETMVMYGVGFGAVSPDIPAGEIVTQQNQLKSNLQILFGQTLAHLSYSGLAPDLVGLYQFNVVVPDVPDSDLVPLAFTLDGVPGSQTLFMAVKQ